MISKCELVFSELVISGYECITQLRKELPNLLNSFSYNNYPRQVWQKVVVVNLSPTDLHILLIGAMWEIIKLPCDKMCCCVVVVSSSSGTLEGLACFRLLMVLMLVVVGGSSGYEEDSSLLGLCCLTIGMLITKKLWNWTSLLGLVVSVHINMKYPPTDG